MIGSSAYYASIRNTLLTNIRDHLASTGAKDHAKDRATPTPIPIPTQPLSSNDDTKTLTSQLADVRIAAQKGDGTTSDHVGNQKKVVSADTNDISEQLQVICYGIGRIGSSSNAQYQLALLLVMRDELTLDDGHFDTRERTQMHRCVSVSVSVFDPVLSALEKDVLEALGCSIITKNEQAKRVVSEPTLFYMPHCPRGMYNNVIWANWGERLDNVGILGNSLTAYAENANLSTIKVHQTADSKNQHIAEIAAIVSVAKHTKEVRLMDRFSVAGIFNDLSLHLFDLPKHLWNQRPVEFVARPNEGEIIIM